MAWFLAGCFEVRVGRVRLCSCRVGRDRRASRAPLLPEYTQECTSCHLAFPPDLLPAASWWRILDNLTGHYGTDASIVTGAGAQAVGLARGQ